VKAGRHGTTQADHFTRSLLGMQSSKPILLYAMPFAIRQDSEIFALHQEDSPQYKVACQQYQRWL